MCDQTNRCNSYSPEQSLSHGVAPFTFTDDYPQSNSNHFDYDLFAEDQQNKKFFWLNEDIASIDALMNELVD